MGLMSKVGKFAGGALNSMTGGLMGRAGNWVGDKIFGASEDKRQLEQQEALQGLQIKGGKEMADYNQKLQLDMLDKTSPAEQMKRLKEAGLSESMMYGGAGGQGQTTGTGGGAMPSGGSAEGSSAKLMANTQMANIALLQAQKENIDADTENKRMNTTDKEQDARGKMFDNEVRGNIGTEAYTEQINSELAKSKQENKIDYRKAINLIDALDEGDGDIIADAFGGYTDGSGWTKLGQQQADELKQNYNKLIAEIENIKQNTSTNKQNVNESISREELNKVEKQIKDFAVDLTGLGLNDTTVKILDLLLRGILGIRIKTGKTHTGKTHINKAIEGTKPKNTWGQLK